MKCRIISEQNNWPSLLWPLHCATALHGFNPIETKTAVYQAILNSLSYLTLVFWQSFDPENNSSRSSTSSSSRGWNPWPTGSRPTSGTSPCSSSRPPSACSSLSPSTQRPTSRRTTSPPCCYSCSSMGKQWQFLIWRKRVQISTY